jgi:hypothetical protein
MSIVALRCTCELVKDGICSIHEGTVARSDGASNETDHGEIKCRLSLSTSHKN